MRKDELRPCIVEIEAETETILSTSGEVTTAVIREAEKFKGYFHRWIDEQICSLRESSAKSYGIVEGEDGTVHKVPPECITFTDRGRKE